MMDLYPDERPREKMMKRGPEALSSAELLAILLRTGTRGKNAVDIGQELLALCDGKISALWSKSLDEIVRFPGVGPAKAVSIAAAMELGRRAFAEAYSPGPTITTPMQVYEALLPRIKGLDHEQCWLLMLDRSGRNIGLERITSGGGSATIIDTRQIMKRALDRQASAIIIVHNHPCGDCMPSKADIEETRRLQIAAKAFNISLLDHVVIADDGFFSFTEDGAFDRSGRKIL
ncbi:MAG: DNA repair protein RadC [Bacteroidales bacterium]|nr:DNA repair protein RadC [Bacteroidales bacterium]